MKKTGRVIIQTRDLPPKAGESEQALSDRTLKALISEVEQYCNEQVAAEVFRKYGVFLRFRF